VSTDEEKTELQRGSELTSRISIEAPEPPVFGFESQNGARRQGFASPRLLTRPCLLRAVLHWNDGHDGRLRRDHTFLSSLG